jgi:hypothetical protein
VAREHTGAWSASGQAELENRIVLLRVELEIYAGGGGREGDIMYTMYFIHM